MIGIVDYGAGNLKSLTNALDRLARAYRICSRCEDLSAIERVLLPGVGQFASAVRHLQSSGLFDELREWGTSGKPIIGICLGLQLLFEGSDEAPDVFGLALLPGRISSLQAQTVPHMGWNKVEVVPESAWPGPMCSEYYYFAHSFVATPGSDVDVPAVVEVDHVKLPAAVAYGAIRAVQFHPEKSGAAGHSLLEGMVSC